MCWFAFIRNYGRLKFKSVYGFCRLFNSEFVMNILFLMKAYGIGGQESVTATLGNSFCNCGHSVIICSFSEPVQNANNKLDNRIRFLSLGLPFRYSNKAVRLIRELLKDNKVDIVINQWGLPFVPAMILYKARKGLDIKVFSVYHHDPETNTRVKSVERDIEMSRSSFKRVLLRIKLKTFINVTSWSMRYVYEHSDRYIVLSKSFVKPFARYAHIKDTNKVRVIPNPLTINNDIFNYSSYTKEKTLLYVGRLERNQKRVERGIDVWTFLVECHKDWKFQIVGDGPDRQRLEKYVCQKGLQRIDFTGFQNPMKYYERSSLLILTSEYEGFGLVIIEAMSFGVVPVVYGSYSAVYDIIEDGKDGFIIPKTSEGFNAAMMADKMANLMRDGNKRNEMALAAIEKSKNYSIENIYSQWMKLMES